MNRRRAGEVGKISVAWDKRRPEYRREWQKSSGLNAMIEITKRDLRGKPFRLLGRLNSRRVSWLTNFQKPTPGVMN